MPYIVEIEQSGRTERLTVDTALAFSDNITWAILIPAAVRRSVSQALREKGVGPKLISARMFAAAVFLPLEEHLKNLERVTIDLEYEVWHNEIRSLLLDKIRRRVHDFPKENIVFRQVGKEAHSLTWLTYPGGRKPGKRVTAGELLKFC